MWCVVLALCVALAYVLFCVGAALRWLLLALAVAALLAPRVALRRARVVTPCGFALKLRRAAVQSRQALLRDCSGLTLLVCKSSYAAVY